MIPYIKYGDWYIPGYNIKFPTENEAWEYINSLTQWQGGLSCQPSQVKLLYEIVSQEQYLDK